MHTGFWWGKIKETGYFENLALNQKIILNAYQKIILNAYYSFEYEDVEWVHVDQTREKWLGPLTVAINLCVPHNMWYLLIEKL